MRFFNILRSKEKINLKLLELQNIVYQNNYDKIVFPEQQILDFACNVYVPQITRIIDDSIELVNNSVVPDTFFFRLDLVIEKFKELIVIEDLIVFNEPLPSEQLNEVMERYNLVIQDFLERYTENCVQEIYKFKTSKGKINKINKFLSEILTYKNRFTSLHLNYIDTIRQNEFNIDHYNINEISKTHVNVSTSNNTPYYLDKNLGVDYGEITHELSTLYNGENKLSKDPKYFKMKEELNKIKQLIINSYNDLYNNNLELSKQGLGLSTELCNYCIDMNYTSSMFVLSETKGYFDFFSEQLEHWKIFNPYKKACQCEKEGNFEQAIELYLDILRNNYPTGTAYYTNPFNLSINLFNYAAALEIYKHLKENYIENKVENLKDIYERYSNRINAFISYKNNYPTIKEKIISVVENNPGILQSTLYKELDLEDKEALRFILCHFEKLSLIKREKSGRSYKLYLPYNSLLILK